MLTGLTHTFTRKMRERCSNNEMLTEDSALHVECTLCLGCLLFGAVANQSSSLGQAKVKGQQRAVLHADGPQSGAINLQEDTNGIMVNLNR